MVAAVAWGLFVVGWIQVARHTSLATVTFSATLVTVVLVSVVLVTAWWVRHNVAIFRRKGPRRGLPRVERLVTADFLGRELAGEWREVRSAPAVVITITEGRKQFVDVGPAR